MGRLLAVCKGTGGRSSVCECVGVGWISFLFLAARPVSGLVSRTRVSCVRGWGAAVPPWQGVSYVS